jgi:hypothetical protein
MAKKGCFANDEVKEYLNLTSTKGMDLFREANLEGYATKLSCGLISPQQQLIYEPVNVSPSPQDPYPLFKF